LFSRIICLPINSSQTIATLRRHGRAAHRGLSTKNTVLNAECFALRQIKAASWCVFTTSLQQAVLSEAVDQTGQARDEETDDVAELPLIPVQGGGAQAERAGLRPRRTCVGAWCRSLRTPRLPPLDSSRVIPSQRSGVCRLPWLRPKRPSKN